MSYSVNWDTLRVTVPVSDLTLVGGDRYTLDIGAFHKECRRIEWSSTAGEGLWFYLPILNHFPTLVLSGIPKTRTVQVANGFTWEIAASNIIVTLTGPDSNLLDTFVPQNGVSLLGNNSIGKQDVNTGSGVTEQDKIDIINGVTNSSIISNISSAIEFVIKLIRNKRVTNPVTGKQTTYDDDGLTKLVEGDLFEDVAGTIPYQGNGADRAERLDDV